MDGLLLVDKPSGWTSHDAVAFVRRALGQKKAGHTGTLDPDATGLLLVLLGKATRLARYYEEDGKEYLGVMELGAGTDTQDASGKVVMECPVPELTERLVKDALEKFVGMQNQTPPMYSAVKVGGRPLYKSARVGLEVERKPRTVEISAIELTGIDGPRIGFRVSCSKGTYIRTLAADIGASLGSCAHLVSLRRTASGGCRVEDAVPVLDKPARDALAEKVIPMDRLLTGLPAVSLTEEGIRYVGQGRQPRPEDIAGVTGTLLPGRPVRLMGGGSLLALGESAAGETGGWEVRPKVVLT